MLKLEIEIDKIKGSCSQSMKVGDKFYLEGYKIKIPEEKGMCIWALNSLIPVFPLLNEKELLNKDHWIKNLKTWKCPDGKVHFKFKFLE